MHKMKLFSGRILVRRAQVMAVILGWGLLLLPTGCVISRNLHSGNSGNGGNGNFTLSVTPATLTVAAGGTATATVTVTLNNGFTGTVNLNATGLPTGATSNFTPASLSGASGSSSLSISTSSTTPVATTSVSISGSDSNNQTQTQTVSLVVNAAGAAAAASACVTGKAGEGWKNTPLLSQAGTFTATFEATPSMAPMNAAVGLSQGAQSAGAGFAGLVVFAPSGMIQARDGASGFGALDIAYTAGQTYRFRMVADVAAHTYSAFVTPPDGAEQTLGLNLAFPKEGNTVDSLDTWGVLVDDLPMNDLPMNAPRINDSRMDGALTACNFAVQ